MKVCRLCGKEKAQSRFSRCKKTKDGLKYECKDCRKKELKAWRLQNPDKNKAVNDKWRIENKDRCDETRRRRVAADPAKEAHRKKEFNKNNPQYNSEYKRQRKQNDPLFYLRNIISSRIRNDLVNGGYSENKTTELLLGCSYEQLLAHLGLSSLDPAYHIDHICPVSQAKDSDELIKLQHFSNLQLLSPSENVKKSNRPTEEGIELCRKLLGRDWL